MKKLVCLLLIVIMTVFALVSCGDGNENNTTRAGGTTKAGGTTAVVEEEKTLVPESFADAGAPAEYKMMVRAGRYSYLYVESDDTSDKVEQAVYERNSKIEEDYDIVFTIDQASDAYNGSGFKSRLDSGEGTWDLVVMDYWWQLENQGYFVNLLNCDEIDFKDDYWYAGWNNNTRLNGRSYTITGDAMVELIQNMEVIFYNKTMASNLGIDINADVNSGDWTIDKMLEYSKMAANTEGDDVSQYVYGALYDLHSMRAQLFAAGLKLTTVSKNGIVQIVANSESNVNITEKVAKLIHDDSVDYSSANCRERDFTKFSSNQALFYATGIYVGESLRKAELDFEYGITLQPKATKEASYVSTNYGSSVFCIPNSGKDIHMSAVILDAMNFYSEDTVVSAYYDTVLKNRLAKDEVSAQMIDLVRDLIYIDFAFIYNGELILCSPFYEAVIANEGIASSIAAVATSAETNLATLIESYQ